jgi:hypothetical protein
MGTAFVREVAATFGFEAGVRAAQSMFTAIA